MPHKSRAPGKRSLIADNLLVIVCLFPVRITKGLARPVIHGALLCAKNSAGQGNLLNPALLLETFFFNFQIIKFSFMRNRLIISLF